MKDRSLDEQRFQCPVCLKRNPGKNINNAWELTGLCDWCALRKMCQDMPPWPPGTKFEKYIVGSDEPPEISEPRPRPVPPERMN